MIVSHLSRHRTGGIHMDLVSHWKNHIQFAYAQSSQTYIHNYNCSMNIRQDLNKAMLRKRMQRRLIVLFTTQQFLPNLPPAQYPYRFH